MDSQQQETKQNPASQSPWETPIFLGLSALYLVFIFAASFYLTKGPVSFDTAITTLLQRGSAFSFSFHNLRDVTTNILLYMPLGLVIGLTLATRRAITLFHLAILFGTLVSLSVEIIQAFIGRVSDWSDVMTNSLGYLIGYLIAWYTTRHLGLSPATLIGFTNYSHSGTRSETYAALRFLYLSVVFVVCLLPLDLTVSLSEIYQKLHGIEGEKARIILDPFYHFGASPINIRFLIQMCLLFIPLIALSAHIQKLTLNRININNLGFQCLLFGLAIEASNIFLKSGRSDIVVPFLGMFTAWITGWLLARFVYHESIQTRQRRPQYFLLVCLYSLLLFAIALNPYEFELDLGAIKNKVRETNLIPFKLHFSARNIHTAIDIVREALLFVPIGVLFALLMKDRQWLKGMILTVSYGAGLALFLEICQIIVKSRYADITDIFLATGGAFLGFLFTARKSIQQEPVDERVREG